MAQNQCRPAPHVAGLLLYANDLAPCGSFSHGSAPTLCVHGYTIHQSMESTSVECSDLGALGGAHLQRWGIFIKFSSIPTEWRNKSFKMDIRHCFQGWKLSKPYVTRWALRHSLHLDALDWGISLWFGQRGLGREGIRFGMQRMRKKQRAPKHM